MAHASVTMYIVNLLRPYMSYIREKDDDIALSNASKLIDPFFSLWEYNKFRIFEKHKTLLKKFIYLLIVVMCVYILII